MTESWTGARRVRAGDTDRDRAVAALQRHHQAGRLTAEEFEDRMGAALAATWLDELPPLLVDLPEEHSGAPGSQRPTDGPVGSRPGSEHEHPVGSPWARGGPSRRGRGPWPLLPVVVLALVVTGSVAAVAHGHFPFPLLWLALVALWWRPWWLRRAWSGRPRR